MDEDKLSDDKREQDQKDEQSPFSSGQDVAQKGENLGQKAASTLRNAATAQKAAEAGAEAGTVGEVGAAGAEGAAATEAAAGVAAGAEAGAAVGAEAATAGALSAGAEAGTAVATTTSSLGPGAAIIATFTAIFILLFVIVFQQGGPTVNAGVPGQTLPPPVIGPPPSCDQIDTTLASSFGITLTGDSADCSAKQIAFTTFSSLFQSEKYATLVRNAGGTTITLTSGACGGRTSGDNFRIGDCSNSSLPYFFAHEMGHVIGGNNPDVKSKFYSDLSSLVSSDNNCYDGRFLKTYLLRTGVQANEESFAESIALYYLGKRTRGVGSPITDFKSQCPSTYSLIKDIIFGGYEFNGSSLPPTGGENTTGQMVTFMSGNHLVTTNYRSSNDCGTYDLSNTKRYPIGNFGNPNCDISKDAVINLIRSTDPMINVPFCSRQNPDKCYNRLDVWVAVVQCESGYAPNAINNHSHSGWGAWGMFQMNPDFSGRAVHDNGTTDWRTQVANAIARNNNTGGGFGYWGCSRGFRKGTK